MFAVLWEHAFARISARNRCHPPRCSAVLCFCYTTARCAHLMCVGGCHRRCLSSRYSIVLLCFEYVALTLQSYVRSSIATLAGRTLRLCCAGFASTASYPSISPTSQVLGRRTYPHDDTAKLEAFACSLPSLSFFFRVARQSFKFRPTVSIDRRRNEQRIKPTATTHPPINMFSMLMLHYFCLYRALLEGFAAICSPTPTRNIVP